MLAPSNRLAAGDLALLPQPKSVGLRKGSLSIRPTNHVVARGVGLEPLAKILSSDIQRVHQVLLPVGQSTPQKGDIMLELVPNDPKLKGPDAYRISVDDTVTIEAGSYPAAAFGMMTVLQTLESDGDGLKIPRMTIADNADRAFRGLQVSIRGGYHPPEWVKRVIDLMRFYKVRVLQLHTTESLWVGAVMESSNEADPRKLVEHSAWSKREMEGVITYAKERGVCLVPHNEMRPNDPFWPAALTVDFNTNDTFACYMDEVDHQGKYEAKGNLADDPRFWNFLKTVTQRSYDQFASSWPDGKLPYYHIGPVYGEGGCNGKEAVRMLEFLKEKNPAIRMMYWNGPGDADPDLTPHRTNIVVDFYSATWGGTPEGLLGAGYEVCNVSWTPLYVLPGTRIKAQKQGKWIFDEFHLARFGGEGPFGEPVKAHDCSQLQKGIVGSLLATWDFAGPSQGEGHLEMIVPCLPFYAEHAWNVQPWPYPKGSWEKASSAFLTLSPLANRFIRESRPPGSPGSVTASQGVLANAVDVLWAESDNFPDYYQVYRADSDDPAKARPISGKIPASFVTRLNIFRDDKAGPGQTNFYWVRAVNPDGPSEFGQPAKGFVGACVAIPTAGESFDYPAGSLLDGLAGGTGFRTPWKIEEFNAPLRVTTNGLTYPGLKTGGRALRVESTDADETNRRRPPHVRVLRSLASNYGQDGTQIWSSYLIRAERLAIGEIAVNIGRANVGKGWGNDLSVYTATGGGEMAVNKTYLLVTRYTFQRGNDLIHLWVNPIPGKQPDDMDANVITRDFENPESDTVSIGMQPYGKGCYVVDEIRVGPSYGDVVPVQN